ncbi:hypothetical protein BO91_01540 [Candidatus Synechococcus spongiarum LMB bulk10E]|nr:hypothetical protein BO91_01540 [Candidatus Synechococcus spongiarum LMB bulk10E]
MNEQINREENQEKGELDKVSKLEQENDCQYDTDQLLEETITKLERLEKEIYSLKQQKLIDPTTITGIFAIIVTIMIAMTSWALIIFTNQNSRIDIIYKAQFSERRMSE